jgi:hypothetical protein
MKFLRVVFLQDAVCLQKIFPDLFIWNNVLFTTPEFKEFKKDLDRCMAESARPDEQRIKDVLPDLSSRMSEEFSAVRSSVSANLAVIERIQKSVDCLTLKFDDIFSGRANVSFNLNVSGRPATPATVLRDEPDEIVGDEECSEPEIARALSLPDTIEALDTVRSTCDQQSIILPPVYKMSRTISTVFDLWREWSSGIGGSPSVKSLEEAWGPKWRLSPTESRFFNRRKIIIDWINRQITDGKTANEAVRILDDRIKASKKSLDWLQKQIKLERAQ